MAKRISSAAVQTAYSLPLKKLSKRSFGIYIYIYVFKAELTPGLEPLGPSAAEVYYIRTQRKDPAQRPFWLLNYALVPM